MAPEITAAFSHSSTTIFIEWKNISDPYWNGEALGYKVKYKKYFETVFHEKVIVLD